jgi:ATP-dependent Clp protease ATP-binding subunit ClpC
MSKLEWFTNRARIVLGLAQEEAQKLHHGMLDTQHMLLGMVLEEEGIAGRVLRETGLNADNVREMVKQMTPANTNISTAPPELSDTAKRALRLAVNEKHRMGRRYVGTEHLLLGLI